MNEQELKEVLQGAIDGKEIQCRRYEDAWQNEVYYTLSDLITTLTNYQDNYQFRVKPEVKTFKYWTRPCMFKRADGTTGFDVWTSTSPSTEDTFRINRSFRLLNQESHPVNFQWLAPATEHEVEYE